MAGHRAKAASTCPVRRAWIRPSAASVGPGSICDHLVKCRATPASRHPNETWPGRYLARSQNCSQSRRTIGTPGVWLAAKTRTNVGECKRQRAIFAPTSWSIPATGEVVGRVAVTSAVEVEAVAARLRAAQPAWQAMGFKGRARLLGKWRDWMLDHADELHTLVQLEGGKSWVIPRPRCCLGHRSSTIGLTTPPNSWPTSRCARGSRERREKADHRL